jgi:hypothetical protein
MDQKRNSNKAKKIPDINNNNEQSKLGFSFNEHLDEQCLDDIYEGDIRQARLVFEMFLMTTAVEFSDLNRDLLEKDATSIKRNLHKMKPNFKLVGLTYYYNQFSLIESLLIKQPSEENFRHNLRLVYEEFEHKYLPILRKELNRMIIYSSQGFD